MAKPKVIAPSDPELVAAAMKRVMPLVKQLPKELQLKEAAIRAAALGGAARIERRKSCEEAGAPTVFGGDLVVAGSLAIGCICIVLGDLEVRDAITATDQQTFLIVGGSLRARGLICRGEIRVAGAVETEVAFVETSSVLAARTVSAELVIRESDHSEVVGKVAGQKLVLNYPDPKALAKLQGLLDPKAFGTVPGDAGLFDFSNLERALVRDKPWRATKARAR